MTDLTEQTLIEAKNDKHTRIANEIKTRLEGLTMNDCEIIIERLKWLLNNSFKLTT